MCGWVSSPVTAQPLNTITHVPSESDKLRIFGESDFAPFFGLVHLQFCRIEPGARLLLPADPLSDTKYKSSTAYYDELIKKYGAFLDQGYVAPLSIKWCGPEMGYGVFADRDLKQGEMIGEYTGVLKKEESVVGRNAYLFTYPSTATSSAEQSRFVVDAAKEGNITRFVNHSDSPNVEVVEVPRGNTWHVVYRTAAPIKKGEQLFISYGQSYWTSLGKEYVRNPS